MYICSTQSNREAGAYKLQNEKKYVTFGVKKTLPKPRVEKGKWLL